MKINSKQIKEALLLGFNIAYANAEIREDDGWQHTGPFIDWDTANSLLERTINNLSETEDLDEELKYLTWFAQNADFGPADGDVKTWLQEKYEKETGNKVPDGWKYE